MTGWLQTARQQSAGKKRQTTTAGGYTFEAKPDGVFAKDSDGNEHMVCSPLWIEAMTRDERNANWGRLLRFIDPDGKEHQWAMPASLRAGQRGEYEAFLADQGVNVFNPKLLHTYLAGQSDQRVLVVSRTGWHRGVFVFADDCIGSDDGEAIFHQSPEGGNHLMQQAGTLDEWKSEVARYCSGNSRLMLAVSAGFAASLLGKLNLQGAGFHFRSSTSKGKTTALLVGGSVWGGGSDKGFLRRWRATINGIESLAESHNDALLCLDELAEVDPRQAGETAYMLANGQAKMRQNKIGGLRKVAEWRTLFLSSGEISLADHLKDGGKRIRGGMEVRLIDLPADAEKGFGLFENLYEMDSAKALADHLQQASKRYFGTPIRAFINKLVTQPESDLMTAWRNVKAEFLTTNLPADAKEEAGRVADYFALVGFAGEAATEAGITGWKEGDAINAAAQMFKEWLAGRGTGSSDEEQAIQQVRKFIQENQDARFRKINGEATDDIRTLQQIAGCREESGDGTIYYISKDVFQMEACKGYDSKSVAKALDSKNFLIKNHGYQFKRRDPESKAMSAFYAISSAVFEGE